MVFELPKGPGTDMSDNIDKIFESCQPLAFAPVPRPFANQQIVSAANRLGQDHQNSEYSGPNYSETYVKEAVSGNR